MSNVESSFPVTGAIAKTLAPNKGDRPDITIAKIILIAAYIISGTFLTTLFFDLGIQFGSILFNATEKNYTWLSTSGKNLKSSFDDLFDFEVESHSYRTQTEVADPLFTIYAIGTFAFIFLATLKVASHQCCYTFTTTKESFYHCI